MANPTDLSSEALPKLREMVENGQGVSRALALDLIKEIERLQDFVSRLENDNQVMVREWSKVKAELANAKTHAEIQQVLHFLETKAIYFAGLQQCGETFDQREHAYFKKRVCEVALEMLKEMEPK